MATEAEKARKALADPETLAVIVLNVGDGDSIIIRFPNTGDDPEAKVVCAVVDCYSSKKTKAALTALGAQELLFVCATHPHSDHIAGLESLLDWCLKKGIVVHQFWDSGFRHVSKTQYDLVTFLRDHPEIKFIRPTSGFEWVHDQVRVLVLSPSIMLRNRYDTFGTNINNASIVLKIEYPTADIALPFKDIGDEEALAGGLSEQDVLQQNTVILGGDAQFDAWARITEEFPHLVPTSNRYQLIDPDAKEHRPLKCQVLKVPHHMSKHGITLEVLETLMPNYTLASCADKSKHGFPHGLTVTAAEDIKSKKTKDKGIRYTGHPQEDLRSGTLVALFKGDGKKPKVYGLGEARGKNAPLSAN